MAKHCTSCNQPYPDDQAACPHCGVAAASIRPVTPGSSPDIILGDQSLSGGSDSDLAPVITDEGSSATHFDRVQDSSMDIDLGQPDPGDSSALIVAAGEQGPTSDVLDVDFSSVADSSSSQPPLVASPENETRGSTEAQAPAEPRAEASDDASGLTVGEAEALAGFGSGSSLEIETPLEAGVAAAAAPDASADSEASDIVGQEDVAAPSEVSDSSAVDLGSYRDENAEGAAAVAGSSWKSLKESGELVGAGTVVPAGETTPEARAGRSWMGGGAVGLLVGAAACVALWTFGVEPPQALRGLVGKTKAPVAHVQPVLSGQPAQRTQPQAPVVQPASNPPAKEAHNDALDKVASALRGDADVKKQDPQLKKVEQDVQLVMQGKQKARAELDAVRKAVGDLGGQAKASASLADTVDRAVRKAKSLQAQLAAVGRAMHLKNADEPVAPALEKLLADQKAGKEQLTRLTREARADKALLQAAVEHLTAARVLPAGAGADKLLASMDQLLTRGPSPVATALGGVATSLGEVGGAATSGASSMLSATDHLVVEGLHNTLAALTQHPRSSVVTTTVLHQPAEDSPMLRLPQTLASYQPESAEKHFCAGCQSYWEGDPDRAAREFHAALQNNHEDARFCYFLGLSLLQQQRQTDAVQVIRRGALLEKQGLPDAGAVNVALERVQGPTRELLDRYRR